MIDINKATNSELIDYIISRRLNYTKEYRAELESKARFQIQALAMRLRRDQQDEILMSRLS